MQQTMTGSSSVDDDIMASLLDVDYRTSTLQQKEKMPAQQTSAKQMQQTMTGSSSAVDDIMASLFDVDYRTTTLQQKEKMPASFEDDIMATLLEVDNHTSVHKKKQQREEKMATTVEEDIMSSLLGVDKDNYEKAQVKKTDQCVAREQSSISASSRLSTSTDDSDLKPIIFDSGSDCSRTPFEMITRLFDQCFHGLFSFTNDKVSENITKDSIVKHHAHGSNDSSLTNLTTPAPRRVSGVSTTRQSISLDYTESNTERRVLFKLKEKQNAASWAKRFEDPNSDLIDSMLRLRMNTTSNTRRLGRKASKIRLVSRN